MTKKVELETRRGLTRRDALGKISGGTGLVTLAGCSVSPWADTRQASQDATFGWGIASGDPTKTAVVIWTRALPLNNSNSISVAYEVSETTDFRRMIVSGVAKTSAERDFTVKVDVKGLQPGREYFYRFQAGRTSSATGRMKTLPSNSDSPINLALVSCSNYPSGFFNAYRELSLIEGLDAVVHVGDYIYEHAAGEYDGATGEKLARVHQPHNEIVSLSDYRRRLAQYREDEDLQAAHAHAPFITVWDDHETANNSWQEGASGHDSEAQGKWDRRRDAALQAYFEWMPMRDPEPGAARECLNRVYDFADIASLIVIETRLTGRTQQLSYADMPVFEDGSPDVETFENTIMEDPARTMMGAAQEAWFEDALHASGKRGTQWQVIANQTVMGRMRTPDFMAELPAETVERILANGGYVAEWLQRSALGLPAGLDSWDGYPAARKRLYNSSAAADANLIVLSGDSHMFWTNRLQHPEDGSFVGMEFATGSVTSPGGYGYIDNTDEFYEQVEAAIVAKNQDVEHANVRDHGFIHLTLTNEDVRARYIKISTILSRRYTADCFLDIAYSAKEWGGGTVRVNRD